MKKAVMGLAVMLLALLMMTGALADRMYVLPESDAQIGRASCRERV